MLIRLVSGTLALLAFAVALIVGVWVGNDVATVLWRAWGAMVLFLIVGAVIGWMIQLVLEEYLEKTTRQVMAQFDESPAGTPMDAAAQADGPGKV